MRLLLLSVVMLSVSAIALAEDESPSEKAIADAIKLLESKRDAIDDSIEAAKIDKAIRELEALIGKASDSEPKSAPLDFAVSVADLKKKFAGKPTFSPKSGELTLTYDFANKTQLDDFEVGDLKVQLAKKMLLIEGGDSLKHVARFKSFTINAVMMLKSMRGGVGLGSANGQLLFTTGLDAVQLKLPAGVAGRRIVRNELRSGAVPVAFSVTSTKTMIRYGNEQLTAPTPETDEVHQVVLNAGTEGCGFSNLVIAGVPDPAWLKEYLGVK